MFLPGQLWSENSDMSRSVQNASVRLIRCSRRGLRFASHEYMSSKRPIGSQERRIMEAIGECDNLETARVWSSHCLKVGRRFHQVPPGCTPIPITRG